MWCARTTECDEIRFQEHARANLVLLMWTRPTGLSSCRVPSTRVEVNSHARPHFKPVLKTIGVVDIVGNGHRPEAIPDEEIAAIKTLMTSVLPYYPHPYLHEGMQVQVIRGPLQGVHGILLRKDKRHRLVLGVRLIQQAAVDTARALREKRDTREKYDSTFEVRKNSNSRPPHPSHSSRVSRLSRASRATLCGAGVTRMVVQLLARGWHSTPQSVQ